MATSLLKYERFETTVQKAKELRPIVERLITLGKDDTLAARRQAYSYLLDKKVVHKLFTDVGPRCKNRNGGYTRIVRTRFRHGDAAQLAVLELVDKATGASGEQTGETAAKTKSATQKAAPSKKPAAKKAAAKKADASSEKAAGTKKGSTAKKAKSS